MNFLDFPINASAGDTVLVTLDKQANVRLLDSANFQRYRRRERYSYHGGLAKVSPARIKVPSTGQWHVVVDLGGYSGNVRASVQVVS